MSQQTAPEESSPQCNPTEENQEQAGSTPSSALTEDGKLCMYTLATMVLNLHVTYGISGLGDKVQASS